MNCFCLFHRLARFVDGWV
jgi:hypothetical protein